MREIKFRAKVKFPEKSRWLYINEKKNGEWVYGELHLKSQYPHIHTDLVNKYPIDPNTIGQFTGMHDKNGVEIYEGDTVKLEYETPFGMDGGIGEIVFTNGAFELKLFGDNEGAYNITNGSNDDLLVLGNTWDVPNLVERRNEQ